jgi:hypothetical protein
MKDMIGYLGVIGFIQINVIWLELHKIKKQKSRKIILKICFSTCNIGNVFRVILKRVPVRPWDGKGEKNGRMDGKKGK